MKLLHLPAITSGGTGGTDTRIDKKARQENIFTCRYLSILCQSVQSGMDTQMQIHIVSL